eukprot:COSAG01_NODE_4084_length_5372_cov_6.319932_3_plen_109_part_00
MLAASKKWESSLEHLERALSIPPANALAQYKKATVLEKLGRHEEALEVSSAPRDSQSHRRRTGVPHNSAALVRMHLLCRLDSIGWQQPTDATIHLISNLAPRLNYLAA